MNWKQILFGAGTIGLGMLGLEMLRRDNEVKDAASRIDVPDDVMEKAANRAAEWYVREHVGLYAEAAMRQVVNNMNDSVDRAVKNRYGDISREMGKRIARDMDKIDTSGIREEAIKRITKSVQLDLDSTRKTVDEAKKTIRDCINEVIETAEKTKGRIYRYYDEHRW